ncbi:RNA polymerase sigma factor SigF, partial [Streptomyces noursei]
MAAGAVIPGQHAQPHPTGADDHGGRLDAAEQAERADHMDQSEQQGQQAERQDPPAAVDRPQDRRPAEPGDTHDRGGARAMFYELRKLPDGSPERAELRNTLVRMHLPL